MSWQRIDENSYIDDTLVTCAEYQLFIDEMLQQGAYCKPDHWDSHQFPAGQARKPILGMRQSDAVSFCRWLARRDGKGWEFRLPTHAETDTFPLTYVGKSPLGYWLNEKFQFAWVGSIQRDPRRLLELNIQSDFNLELGNTIVRSLDINRTISQVYSLGSNMNYMLGSAFDIYIITDTLNDVHHRNLSFSRNLTNSDNQARKFAIVCANAHARYLDFALDVYIDVLTLAERIAGRSPAFEGIRLVKERIK